MTTFLAIYFFISILVFAFLVYRFLIKKSIKQELIEAKAKLKTAETINEMLNNKLPGNCAGRLERFKKLVSTNK